jgi:hypothetical protein
MSFYLHISDHKHQIQQGFVHAGIKRRSILARYKISSLNLTTYAQAKTAPSPDPLGFGVVCADFDGRSSIALGLNPLV